MRPYVRAGIPLSSIECAWFDEKEYYSFSASDAEVSKIAIELESHPANRRLLIVRKKGSLPNWIRSVDIIDQEDLVSMFIEGCSYDANL